MRALLLVAVLALSGPALAAIDTYEFQSEAERARFRNLTEELRCPKCQNQNIADSDAPIATDLRREIHRMLGEGQSNQQIVDFLVMRYGDFVMYKPPLDRRTWLLWFGPALLLGGGALVLGSLLLRRRKGQATAGRPLTEAERARLDTLLNTTRDTDT